MIRGMTECRVCQDGELDGSNEYIAILIKTDEETTHSFYANTDTFSLGMGIKILLQAYADSLENETPEMQEEITRELGFCEDYNILQFKKETSNEKDRSKSTK